MSSHDPAYKYTTASLQAAKRHYKAAKKFHKKGLDTLARERLVIAGMKAQQCITNCVQAFGRWESAYDEATELQLKIDKLRSKLYGTAKA